MAEIEKQRLAKETERNRLAEEKRLADEAEAEKKRLADEAERKRLADIKVQQDAKKKKEAARKKMIADFRKKARRKPICVKGERNLKKNTLWAIMKQNKIPNPYGTAWKGQASKSRLGFISRNAACGAVGFCSNTAYFTVKFNRDGTYTGYAKAKNKNGKFAILKHKYSTKKNIDRGLLRICYQRVKSRGKYRDKVFIHSRSFKDRKEIRNTITSKSKSWNMQNEDLGKIKMTLVDQ